MFRTGNPALTANTFTGPQSFSAAEGTMTIQGTVNKTLVLLACLLITASWIWGKIMPQAGYEGVAQGTDQITKWLMLGVFGGFITAIVTMFSKQWAAVTAPIYALFEGLALGGISAIFEMRYPGIVIHAVGLTFATLFALLMAYKSGFIKATENFKLGIVAATGGICIVYLVDLVLGFFGKAVPFLYDNGPLGIGISVFIVIIAALNLVLDFDFIEHGSESGAPKYMEWYGAFGLMVTLVWLYLEILRLLAKLSNNRR